MADPVRLIVDDAPHLREVIEEHLCKCGFLVSSGTNPDELRVHAKQARALRRSNVGSDQLGADP